jgi:hypothetical protein
MSKLLLMIDLVVVVVVAVDCKNYQDYVVLAEELVMVVAVVRSLFVNLVVELGQMMNHMRLDLD